MDGWMDEQHPQRAPHTRNQLLLLRIFASPPDILRFLACFSLVTCELRLRLRRPTPGGGAPDKTALDTDCAAVCRTSVGYIGWFA